ncbi:ATP-dependent DNA ligase [Microbacterium mangrovi]|uniref:ATP-dependent DNA ligase n=1 Tax=Microbacterium mangrovi TaxID=1348253 RepID=A0A0B2AAX6_9MICO|nr:hypothetical protein [Microbacterium mangrovi]KHK98746.1 ATP-dependent DNA ligase [Microbacterium mangrovi]
MGKLTYDKTVKADFEDRALTHLQIVMVNKLRRGEPFMFSWKDDASLGNGRTTIWVHPSVSLVFKFYGSRRPDVNPAWIEALAQTANAQFGLYLVPEPSGPAASRSDEHDMLAVGA